MVPTLLVAGGSGLIAAAALRLVVRGNRRAALMMGAAVATAIAAVATPLAAAVISGILLIAMVGRWLLNRQWIHEMAASVGRVVRHPAWPWMGAGIIGALLVAGGVARIHHELAAMELEDTTRIGDMLAMPPLDPEPVTLARTDCGSTVPLRTAAELRDPSELRHVEQEILEAQNWSDLVIRKKPPADVCNCHGWIFAEGRFWISTDDVERILDDNGYQPVAEARPGDLAIYRNSGGEICHSAVVCAVLVDGTVLVEGKWGWMGVFLHRVQESCYGADVTFYHSSRSGHRLAGVPDRPVVQSVEARAE